MSAPIAPAESSFLRLEGISKAYGRTPVLIDLDLDAEPGELTVVYGPPASGKSVLVRILTGLEHPDAGSIFLRGQDVTSEAPAERNIGYVPQSFALYPHLSVRANIAYPLDLANVPAAESRGVVAEAAAMLKIEEHLDKKPDQLSGGQKQRVAIARGIAKRTDVFILDDPLAGLDFKLREQLVDDLRGLNSATGASVLYMTSDVIEAMTLADTLAVLSAGTVIDSGPPERLYRQPRVVGTMALVGFPPANFMRGSLQRLGDEFVCLTPLFRFRADIANGYGASDVIVGIRPERMHLSRRNPTGEQALNFPASITLREDLGGEDIVYLDANGIALTMVDRDHNRASDLGDTVEISIAPSQLTLFDATTGERIGHGAHDSASASRLPPPASVLHHG